MSQQSFRELGASRPVVDALAARSIHYPFRIQTLVLPDALGGLDVLAKSPTGSGKTLAFALPIVERTNAADGPHAALVLVPTRELCSQVADELVPLARARGLTVAAVYGGAASPWSSSGRSAVPPGSCRSSHGTEWARSRCTATCRRARARKHSRGSGRASSRRSSPPTSPPEVSTSPTSPTSSTSIRPRT